MRPEFEALSNYIQGALLRRLLSVAAVAAVSVGMLVPAADAVTSPTVSYKGLPAGWSNGSINCTSGAPVALNASHVTGPATPHDGSGSLKIAETNGISGAIQADFSQTEPALSTLSAFDAYLYASANGGVPGSLLIEAYDPTTNLDYEFSLDLAAPDQWLHLDAATATLSWNSWNDSTGADAAQGTDTLQSFLADPAHANVKLDQLVVAGPCDPGTFYVDSLNYAVGATVGTIDFEAPTPTTLTNGSHPATMVNGQSTTLSATLKSASTPLAGLTAQLYAKSTGSTIYKLLKTVTTNASGIASAAVAPANTTSYQWRFPNSSSAQYAPSNAPAYTIVSRQRVVVTAKPAWVTYRTTAVVSGYVRPIKGGVTVRLVRLVSGKRIVVGYARTGPRGAFAIDALMTVRGTSTYLVSALPYPGQDLGQSATFKITTK